MLNKKIMIIALLLLGNIYSQDVSLTISTDKADYRFGEKIVVGFEVQNISEKKIEMIWPSCWVGNIRLNLMSNSNVDFKYTGPTASPIKKLVLEPNERYYFLHELNELYGEFFHNTHLKAIESEKYLMNATLKIDDEKVLSNTVRFRINPPNDKELRFLNEFKKNVAIIKQDRTRRFELLKKLLEEAENTVYHSQILMELVAYSYINNEETYEYYREALIENYPETIYAAAYVKSDRLTNPSKTQHDSDYKKMLDKVKNPFWKKHYQQRLKYKEEE